MKVVFSFFLFLIFYKLNGQLSPPEKETKFYIDNFKQVTVSLGLDTIATFQDINGVIVQKRIFKAIGSGVIFYVKDKIGIIPCIITAKHVLFDTVNKWLPQNLNIRFNQNDTLPIDTYWGQKIILYDDKYSYWFAHPDSSIDLACIPLDSSINLPNKRIQVIPYSYFPNDNEYYEGKDVYVLGYPEAVGLDLLNRAVIRKGVIAWVPANINSSKKILIDCNIFPGNSGGPVFSVPHNSGIILDDTVFNMPRFYGIVSQRRFSNNQVLNQKGQLIKDVSGDQIVSLESIGIGVIISARRVRELLDFTQSFFDKLNSERSKK